MTMTRGSTARHTTMPASCGLCTTGADPEVGTAGIKQCAQSLATGNLPAELELVPETAILRQNYEFSYSHQTGERYINGKFE